MQIDYDVNLYRKIAQLHLDEIVTTKNRKGRVTTIHLTNITRLSWQELQLLISNGTDRFSKMVLLYEQYSNTKNPSKTNSTAQFKGKSLVSSETKEINAYIDIFKSNGFVEHHEVNQFISDNNKWDDFPTIRSLNNHGESKNIKGILPKYFQIICNLLKISNFNGHPLDKSTHY